MRPDDTELAQPIPLMPTRSAGVMVGLYPLDWRFYIHWRSDHSSYLRLHVGPIYVCVDR